MLDGYIDAVRRVRPVVHCMTNYVTAGDCANALLAVLNGCYSREEARDILKLT